MALETDFENMIGNRPTHIFSDSRWGHGRSFDPPRMDLDETFSFLYSTILSKNQGNDYCLFLFVQRRFQTYVF